MSHDFRSRLLAGELLVGTMVTQGSAEIAELLAGVGFDWLFVDGEHSPLAAADVQRVLLGAGRDTPCLVRVAASEESAIKQALDSGAAGIIVPMVNSAEQAAQVVRWAKYPPLGSRGVGVGRAHGYGMNLKGYLDTANDDISVVIQAEHIKAVENIERIVEVQGIDAVFIGPYDLSASLGKIGELDHPQILAAVDHVTQVCRQVNVALGCFGLTAEAVRPYMERGYTLITVGIETMILGFAAEELLARVRN